MKLFHVKSYITWLSKQCYPYLLTVSFKSLVLLSAPQQTLSSSSKTDDIFPNIPTEHLHLSDSQRDLSTLIPMSLPPLSILSSLGDKARQVTWLWWWSSQGDIFCRIPYTWCMEIYSGNIRFVEGYWNLLCNLHFFYKKLPNCFHSNLKLK